jgi:hypothetical protein
MHKRFARYPWSVLALGLALWLAGCKSGGGGGGGY